MTHPPTSDKPQSKLWWNDGSWWAYMWVTNSGWHIERFNRSTHNWVDTGVLVDPRSTTLADTLWDGSHLFVASQVATVSSDSSTVVSQSGQPARLYRYSYSGGNYTLDSGFPTPINNNSSESLTIDEDSRGRIWATWTQVSSATNSTVYVNVSAVGGASWQTPFVVPGASDPNPTPDDISAVVAFKSKIGVMWTDQATGTTWFAWRNDSQAVTSWKSGVAVQGNKLGDDHLNLKSLQADNTGRVFAAVKTSLDEAGVPSSSAQINLLVYKPATGNFTSTQVSTIADCQTRPQVVLDATNNQVRVYSAGPSTSLTGCPYSGTEGAIYMKSASMDNPVFSSGRGTPVIEDGSSAHVNNVTTSKQPVTSNTGVVILASNDTTKSYWFADSAPSVGPVSPVASFTALPTSGSAPLDVQFTDTSSGTPTSWAWDFGDGSTSTLQGPSHTYTAAGTYTVKLTATNSVGSNTVTTAGAVTVAGTPVKPVASFTATPTSGTAPLTVQFSDTSTNLPTSWAWDFGDGGSSTVQNPSHNYTAAGTYTVTLTATNSAGSTSKAGTVTVNAPSPGGIVVGASTSISDTTGSSTTVALSKPSGIVTGDFLVAEFNANNAPTVSSVPSGWSALVTTPMSTGANSLFTYYHVVTSASSEPATWSWTLSSAQKWGGGITNFHGVNTATPFDTAAASKVQTASSTSIALPGVTTQTANAMVIGGVGIDAGSYTTSPPSGWAEAWEATGAQTAAFSSKAQAAAGATGTVTFTISNPIGAAAWMRALRPA